MYHESGGRTITFVKECFDIGDIKPEIATLTDAISLENAYFAPHSYGVGVDVEQVGDFSYGEHPGG